VSPLPERLDGCQELVRALAAIGERGAQRLELLLDVTGADADDQPAVGQHVDRRQLLGQQDGVPLREDGHAAGQSHPAGHACEVRQRRDQFQPRFIGGIRGISGQRDVIADPERLETDLLGPLGPPR
jgi:hypothetical protein